MWYFFSRVVNAKTPKNTPIESETKPPSFNASGISPIVEAAIMIPALKAHSISSTGG